MPDKVRYGILGTSRIARNAHVPAARLTANSEIIAVASRDKARAADFAGKLDIPRAYGSYDELLADPDVDAVINPLPNSLHCEWTIRAARAGKHVLCEKPLAVTVDEARRMIDACSRAGVKLMEAFKIRFMPQQDFVREQIDSGAIGELRIARCELCYTLGDWDNDVRGLAHLAGGALLDAGCYCVNQARFVMGAEPVAVQGFRRVHPRNKVDCSFIGILKFPGDRLAFIATGMEQPFFHRCEIVGTQGRIEVPNMFGTEIVRVFRDGKETAREFPKANPHVTQLEHFSDCVLRDRKPKLSPQDSLRNTAVLEALKLAAEAEKVVRL